jgi:hypothetical protein
MELTMGSMMFYGGIAGAVLTLIAALVTFFVMSRSRARLKTKFDDEYGKR